jgi:histidine phosphotransferase ChpT
MTDTQLAALLASRICHDLISPVGAINNGLELFEMMGGDHGGQEIDLIRMSADAATANLKFMRAAFGAADIGGVISVTEVKAAIAGYLGPKFNLNWLAADTALTRTDAQLVCLAAMITAGAAPLGGGGHSQHMRCGTGANCVVCGGSKPACPRSRRARNTPHRACIIAIGLAG